MTKMAPYGSWKSPITSDLIVAGTVRLGQIALSAGAKGPYVYWTEGRPTERGRSVVVRRSPDGESTDLTPPLPDDPSDSSAVFNVRTRVHEYGGGAFFVSEDTLYFSNFVDQRLYRQEPGQPPRPITPEAALRYADGLMDQQRGRIICVREDHTASDREAINALVALDPDGTEPAQVLAEGHDFYASPCLSPDGQRLAWLTWDHPNMPWDGSELWVAEIREADGTLGDARRVAGGSEESIFQPQWSPDGILYFVSDRTGWWNLYRWREGQVEPLYEMEAEFGLPQWVFGMSTYAFESAQRLVCTYSQSGMWHLATLDTTTLTLKTIDVPYTSIDGLRAAPGRAVFIGGAPTAVEALVQLDLETGQTEVLRRSSALEVEAGYLSAPRPIAFPTAQDMTAYGLYYPPQNKDFKAPADERPPLLVMSHGGPTAATASTLSPKIQYWTSRGIAVLDVNYRGSTGYGRAYREQLNDHWGIADVEDCINGARYLAQEGAVDASRLMIRGGSAGGYTTLCALTFYDTFQAGASHFGVSDLAALAQETHKFESRYLDRLVGPYPEAREVYEARSPLHHAAQLACPAIFLQGLEDKVVPPNQAEKMVESLRAKGVPVAYLAFEGEGHGFRQAENIKRALEAELYFYSQVFGFELGDPVAPVEIENL